ncbi:hypothetical protein GCM10007304_19840 [Rhodococcoides trifolii]|uniref:Uncharacterized protein n=1 Tax=Rhodococcoides trifolii TaxID=908250 RepID=A0A917D0Q5_9NOCA|nr:hypothetical protein [Rhodococcus trifolii]GGG05728.1 hypothetical protein GCM10007304_19840 [Rhodococcus trifolii]
MTVDIAGTAWPVYKLESLALGLMVFLATFALAASLQPAVLLGAAIAVAAWLGLPAVQKQRPAESRGLDRSLS